MSVRKRIWKTKQGEAREAWVVDYIDSDGRHIETFDRKKDADARHAEVAVNVKRGVHVAPSKSITVEAAAKRWLDDAAQRLERATCKTYAEHVNIHIVPLLGRLKLSEISVPVVAQFKKDLRARKVKPLLTRKILVSLGAIIADAQENGLAAHNAVRDLRRNKKQSERKLEQRHKRKLKVGVDIPTKEEVSGIIRHAPDRWRALLVTAAFTGLRASELRGLRWGDVDLKKGELHVRQRADRFNEIGSPKSEDSERTVPFGSFVANTLKEWKLKHPGELVFATSKGTIVEHSNLVKASIIPASPLDPDGKPKYTGLHCLRHFYASWCIDRGMPGKVVQERMGHSSITITMDTYGHLFPRGDDTEELTAAEEGIMALSATQTRHAG
jgi:integrase